MGRYLGPRGYGVAIMLDSGKVILVATDEEAQEYLTEHEQTPT